MTNLEYLQGVLKLASTVAEDAEDWQKLVECDSCWLHDDCDVYNKRATVTCAEYLTNNHAVNGEGCEDCSLQVECTLSKNCLHYWRTDTNG
jgi:hypothetical protein